MVRTGVNTRFLADCLLRPAADRQGFAIEFRDLRKRTEPTSSDSEIVSGGSTMATLAFPKGKTAILIMDCQNDIVHENGKMAATNNGVMAKLIKERNVLGTIARLAAAGRKTGVPIIHVRHAYR